MEWIMVDMYCTFFPNKEFKGNSRESKVILKFEVLTKADLVNNLFIKELKGSSGMQFCLPPNSLTQMRLREDGCGKITLFKELFSPHYKLGGSLSFRRFKHKVGKLEKLILNDMRNIDRFITQWHSIYQTNSRDWNGNEISLEDK